MCLRDCLRSEWFVLAAAYPSAVVNEHGDGVADESHATSAWGIDQGFPLGRRSDAVAKVSPLVVVGTYRTRSEAEIAQAALASAGIPSLLEADDAGGAYPFDLTGSARLLVGEADEDDAAAVLGTQPQPKPNEE